MFGAIVEIIWEPITIVIRVDAIGEAIIVGIRETVIYYRITVIVDSVTDLLRTGKDLIVRRRAVVIIE